MSDVLRGLATVLTIVALAAGALLFGMWLGDQFADATGDHIERLNEQTARVELETARLECVGAARAANMPTPKACR